jgi:hypothetical protein
MQYVKVCVGFAPNVAAQISDEMFKDVPVTYRDRVVGKVRQAVKGIGPGGSIHCGSKNWAVYMEIEDGAGIDFSTFAPSAFSIGSNEEA